MTLRFYSAAPQPAQRGHFFAQRQHDYARRMLISIEFVLRKYLS